MIEIEKPKWILCDIEGTTSSISFVKDNLFTYIRQNLKSYLETTWNNEITKEDVRFILEQYKIDRNSFDPNSSFADLIEKDTLMPELIRYIFWLMDNDLKTTALKTLQGHIWQNGYETGNIVGHVYEDVPTCFQKWISQGIQIAIYSSGSVLAQKLLFKYNNFGDLTKHISFYFDTIIGGKKVSQSYKKILNELNVLPTEIIFLTDIVDEAIAADGASIKSILLQRNGTLDDADKRFTWIQSFDEIQFKA